MHIFNIKWREIVLKNLMNLLSVGMDKVRSRVLRDIKPRKKEILLQYQFKLRYLNFLTLTKKRQSSIIYCWLVLKSKNGQFTHNFGAMIRLKWFFYYHVKLFRCAKDLCRRCQLIFLISFSQQFISWYTATCCSIHWLSV